MLYHDREGEVNRHCQDVDVLSKLSPSAEPYLLATRKAFSSWNSRKPLCCEDKPRRQDLGRTVGSLGDRPL